MNLYEIGDASRAILAELEDADGELDDELDAKLDAIQGALEDKTEAYCAIVRTLEGQAEIAKKEADRLAERSRLLLANAKRMKERLRDVLTMAGQQKVKTPKWSVTLRKAQPRLVLSDASLLPSEYLRVRDPEPDKKALLVALKAGKDVSGAGLELGEPAVLIR